jgi:hypothetical protein
MPSDKDNELDGISRELHKVKNMIRAIGGQAAEPYVPDNSRTPGLPYCSFCGKDQSEVSVLVEGPSIFICDECVEKAGEIVREGKSRAKPGVKP